jgi:putative hydrolase of the HAD superfamily
MIRAVTFDVGGTLIAPFPSVGHIYAEVAAAHGVTGLDPADVDRRFAEAWKLHRPETYVKAEWAALVDATFAGLTSEPPSRTFFDELYARFTWTDCWRIFDDVLPTLVALRTRGLRLGLISNWDERLRPLLDALELTPCFDACLISCEVGAAKPDGLIFAAAAEALELKPREILHVGDGNREDVGGALVAGFQPLLIDRNQPAGNGRISDLRQILSSRLLSPPDPPRTISRPA